MLPDIDGDLVTPLVNGGECAYVILMKKASPNVESKSLRRRSCRLAKPISCHLYPIRVTEYRNFSAINYHEWDVCSDACTLGKELQVPVYKFLENATD